MNPLLINALELIAEEVHENAVSHGFHNFDEDEGAFIARAMMLINTETAELFESYRNHALRSPCDKCAGMQEPLTNLEEELADVLIRTLDISKRLGVDIGRAVSIKHDYNTKREYRHGNKLA